MIISRLTDPISWWVDMKLGGRPQTDPTIYKHGKSIIYIYIVIYLLANQLVCNCFWSVEQEGWPTRSNQWLGSGWSCANRPVQLQQFGCSGPSQCHCRCFALAMAEASGCPVITDGYRVIEHPVKLKNSDSWCYNTMFFQHLEHLGTNIIHVLW